MIVHGTENVVLFLHLSCSQYYASRAFSYIHYNPFASKNYTAAVVQ